MENLIAQKLLNSLKQTDINKILEFQDADCDFINDTKKIENKLLLDFIEATVMVINLAPESCGHVLFHYLIDGFRLGYNCRVREEETKELEKIYKKEITK